MMLISGGTVIDPASDLEGQFDILVKGGKIAQVAPPGKIAAGEAEVVKADGRWVVPGLIDLHVHLREPGQEWKETVRTGCEAAVLGGFTSICAMPNTKPSNHSAEVTEYMIEKGVDAAAAKVLPIGAVSVDLKGRELAPLSELRKAGCVAFSDDGEPVYDAGLMRRALEWCLMLDVPISCHEEDKSLSCGGCMNESALSTRLGLTGMPKVAEDVMVARDIELGLATGGRVHICHVSTARSVELIRRAKNDGVRITAEVTPHHLVLTEEAVRDYDTGAKMSPPLREEEDRVALLEGLQDGTIDAVASDHAPHENDAKEIEFAKAAFGILGLQTSLPLLLDFVEQGILTRRRAIESLTASPARAFGLSAGTLSVGSAADIVILDPKHEWSFERDLVASLSYNSPFLGRTLKGIAESVFVDGRLVVQDRTLLPIERRRV